MQINEGGLEEIKRYEQRWHQSVEDDVVKSVEDEDDVFLATNDEVAKTKWMMDSAVSKHICRDRDMFDTLKIDGEFSHFKLGHLELR